MSKKSVLITGASKGIGKAIAEGFHSAGWQVAVFSRSAESASLPSGVLAKNGDVRKKTEIQAFVAEAAKKFSGLDSLVNCAGVSRWKKLDDIDEAFMNEVMETNLHGALWASQAAARVMKSGGAILNLSSLAGKRGSANNSAYCASKFALNGLTQALAKELGPKGIRVNAVCPVYVETDMILESLKDPAAPPSGKKVDAYLKDFAQTQTALKRLPTTGEVFEAVRFLCSDAASGISGQCLNVDCGTLPQ